MTDTATRVGRVRVQGGGRDPALARQRLAAALAATELRPAGLPPAAILLVRRLADPLPGRLDLDAGGTRPPPEWERAAAASLGRLASAAVRPARAPVPEGAQSVLFADHAELLAWLVAEVAGGTAWSRWWWRGSLRAARVPEAEPAVVAAALAAAPRHVPAAIELLARGERLGDLATTVAPDAALPIGSAVAETAGAGRLATVLRTFPAGADRRAGTPSRDAPRHPPEPWRALAPEAVAASLPPAHRALAGVALASRRAPVQVASRAFAAAVERWIAGAGHERVATPSAPVPADPPGRGSAPEDPRAAVEPVGPRRTPVMAGAPGAAAAPRAASGEQPRPARRGGPAAARPVAGASPPGDGPLTTPAGTAGAEEPVGHRPGAPGRVPSAASPAPAGRPSAPPPLSAPVPSAGPDPWPPLATRVDTDLGGLFYLLNLALHLDLYVDFTRPRDRGIAISPWGYLALLGPVLLRRGHRDDPLWRLLARLEGRSPEQPPGHGFRPPRAWRVTADWLEPFDGAGTWRWSAAGGELRVMHPSGFLVTAVPLGSDVRAQLTRELRRLRLRPASVERGPLPRESKDAVRRWAGRMAAYARARLVAAGCAPAHVVRARARVWVTPSHVDVVLQLAELPIEVRFAGLDRTPGWIPAAGRFVAFHFE